MGRHTQDRTPPGLTPPTRRRRSHPRPWWRSRRLRRRIRRAAKWAALALGVAFLLCGISAAFVAPSVLRAARDGRTALIEAGRAVVRRDADAARVEFQAASQLFGSANARLSSPLTWPLRVAPIANTNVGVARSLVRIGSSVSEAGVVISDTMDSLPEQSLVFRDGGVDLDEVRKAREALRTAAAMSAEIDEAIVVMPGGWVGGPLAGSREQAREMLPPILDGVRKAEAALDGLPSILAGGGRKRYLVAFSNLSELRGSGGLFGYVTALEAEDGDLDLEDLSGRPTEIFPEPGEVGLDYPDWFPSDFRTQAEIFQNINMTTDFPTVGRFVVQTAEAEFGDFDGVIAVDPIGIGAVLGLTGPVRVPTWPRQITATNVAKIAMHDVYVSIPSNAQRELFFEQLVRAAFDALTSSTIRLSAGSAGVFDQAVRGGHFRMYSEHDDDQAVFDVIDASGTVDRASGATDVLSVVSENASGSKIDWYLRRDLRYVVALDPGEGTATGQLSATFRNTAPPSGLPDYVIGSALPDLPRGTSQQIVLVLRGHRDDLRSLTVDGDPVTVVTEREADLRAHRMTVSAGPRGRSELVGSFATRDALVTDGGERVYRLHVLRQAVANPDFAEISVRVPRGWTAVGQTSYLGDLTQDVVLEVRVRRTIAGSLISEPFRSIRRLLERVF